MVNPDSPVVPQYLQECETTLKSACNIAGPHLQISLVIVGQPKPIYYIVLVYKANLPAIT